MYVASRRWDMPLNVQPIIVQAGIGTHGVRNLVENYSHLGIWCVHVYRYFARLRQNDEWFDLAPGYVSVCPPDAELEYHYRGQSQHVYAHFYLPKTPDPQGSVAAVQDLGPAFAAVYHRMEEVVSFHTTQPTRAAVRLWDLLWQISEARAGQPAQAHMPAAITQLLRGIELRLGQRLPVSALAAEAGLSHNHLIRLFRQWTGLTPVQYLRRRRVERATHLLTHTTLPIKAVAAEVGIPDLHLFNKIMRRATTQSPRALRAAT